MPVCVYIYNMTTHGCNVPTCVCVCQLVGTVPAGAINPRVAGLGNIRYPSQVAGAGAVRV
jgi:hypothetical protein